jgi:protein O-mannosyl-transferase
MKKLAPVIIFLVSFLVYSNIRKNDFALDDTMMIELNQYTVKGFKGIGDLVSKPSLAGFTSMDKNTFRPLTMGFFGFQYQFFKLSPKAYHGMSILLYGILCILVYYFLQNLNFEFWPSVIGTLFFTVHPIHTEVVANIKSQDEILALIFSVSSFIWFIKYAKKPTLLSLIFSGVFTLLALFSKENTIVIVLMIPVLLYFMDLKPFNTRVLGVLGTVTLFYFLCRKMALGNFIMTKDPSWQIPINNALFQTDNSMTRFATEIVLLVKYLILTVFPYPLSADYSVGAFELSTVSSIAFILSFICILVLLILIYRGIPKKSFVSLGLLLFFIPFATNSNIIFKIAATFAERFVFFPSLGASVLLAYLLVKLIEKFKLKFVALWISGLVILIFSNLTFQRNKDWKNSLTIFESAIKVYPNAYRSNIGLANSNNKLAISTSGEDSKIYRDKAYEYNQKAYKAYNQGYEINHSFGVSYQLRGEYDKAIRNYQKALEDRPFKPEESYENLSQCYIAKANCDSAYLYLEKVVNDGTSYLYVGDCFFDKKNYLKAANCYEKAWSLGPKNNSDNATNLAVCFQLIGNYEKAKSYYKIAINLNPANEKAKMNLGTLR